MPLFATVALDLKFSKTFDYEVPEPFISKIQPGYQVEVPLKGTLKKGIVVTLSSQPPPYSVKPIYQIFSPLITQDLMKIAVWMADYYCTPLPLVLPSLFPSAAKETKFKEQHAIFLKKSKKDIREALIDIRKKSAPQAEILDYLLIREGKTFLSEILENTKTSRSSVDLLVKKGFLELEKMRIDRFSLKDEEHFRSKPKQLTEEQKTALNKIELSLCKNIYETHLLHGVTGSGKTEVYLQAISKALEEKKGVIMLVPEISLTTQTIEHFKSRFDENIAILHYRLSDGEKHDEWKRIQEGRAKIVIGARSSIFSPVQNLGLIIVDEEQENSYKQSDQMPAYHARDVAVMRGFHSKATVVLGSATPSLETYYNAQSGKYTLSQLKQRPKNAPLPSVDLVDMKEEYDKKKGLTIFSEKLLSKIEDRLKKGEQTVLFLNRRGFHTMMLCSCCGNGIKCAKCDLSMTFHKNDNALSCHLCHEFLSPPPRICPHCQKEGLLKFKGIGTEQVEAALYAIFPSIRILRLDADTTKHKGNQEKLYKSFRSGKADLLIGTQMIAKGLHFPEVTLVGILNSDISLNIPDFRSSETTFQLLTQVAGRAGRGALPGEVIIQTAAPDNTTIKHASKQDFDEFYKEEIQSRTFFQFPPFSSLAKIRFSSKDLSKTEQSALAYQKALVNELTQDYEISPIAPAGHAKIKEQHRLQFFIKGSKIGPIKRAIQTVQKKIPIDKNVRVFIDINPISLFF